jgi:hypothetical protein
MKRITILSDNCNAWNKKDFTNIADYDLECGSCSVYGRFSHVQTYYVWRWEIDVPYNWRYGNWEDIKLYPTQAQIVLVSCDVCGEMHRLYPSFMLKGTTLTLSALVFIAYTYESSGLTWREIPDKFCDAADRIAHSTLFKAVHGLGKGLVENDRIRGAVVELASLYSAIGKAWPPAKSRYAHTLNHEHSLRELLLPLLPYKFSQETFTRFFFKYLRPLRILLSGLSPPIHPLYPNFIETALCPPEVIY